MPILQRFDNARVLMYLDDHLPPHVHIKLNDGRERTVDIASFVIVGRVTRRDARDVLAWIKASKDFLDDEWLRFNP